MKNFIKQLLRENLQLADKVYFNSGKLSPEVREIILRITNGDPYTKIMTDIYYAMLMDSHRTGNWALKHLDPEHQETEKPDNDVMNIEDLKKLRPIYNQLKNYNKNVFPIKGFNINGVENIGDFIWALKQRQLILDIMSKLPSIASRNMKSDIRKERNGSEMNHYRDELESVIVYLSHLNNRDEETQRKILSKVFTSNTTLDNVYDFVTNKENLIGGVDMTRKQIGQILKKDSEEYGELKVKYNKNNIMVIEVSGPDGIKEIGCNSLWCFTYNSRHGGLNWHDWQNNSTNGYCYVIINFSKPSDSSDFMYVLTKPFMDAYDGDEEDDDAGGYRLFDMSNDTVFNPIYTIESMMDLPTAIKIMNFGVKPPKPKKKKFVDPNQLSLDLHESKHVVKNTLIESLVDLEDDVDMLYNMYFKEAIDEIRLTGKINRRMFPADETNTSILKSKVAKLANEKNMCIININTPYRNAVNFYRPESNLITIGVNDMAVNYILSDPLFFKDVNIAASTITNGDQLKLEFTPERIKGSIHHELAHWVDDTLNNRHILDKLSNNKLTKKHLPPVNAQHFEIQGQIHNVFQLKREYEDVWDNLSFDKMITLSPSLNLVNTQLKGEVKDKWRAQLLHRMSREGLLGKQMR